MKKIPMIEKYADAFAAFNLRKMNFWLAGLYTVQGLAIWALGTGKQISLSINYLVSDSVTSELSGRTVLSTASRYLFDISLACLLAVAMFVIAAAHILAATVWRERYEADLKKRVNRLRWLQFGVGEGLLLLAIGMVSGVVDLSTLCMILVFKVLMDIILLVVEREVQGGRRLGSLGLSAAFAAGVMPWVVLGIYVLGANIYGAGDLPSLVYPLYATAILAWLVLRGSIVLQQFKKQGRWKEYQFGERLYMVISVVAASAIGWQILIGVLQP